MAAQLAFCYSSNRSSHRPLDLMISGLSGRMKAKFESTPGKPHESWKGVEWWEEGYEELWAEPAPTPSTSAAVTSVESSANGEVPPGSTPTTPAVTPIPPVTIGTLNGQPRSRVPKSSIIYLTGDSPNVLTTLEEGKTYILGGIVDRNRYKRLCFDKAEQHGIQHAQLPIAEFMPDMPTRKVLTVNQVSLSLSLSGSLPLLSSRRALTAALPLPILLLDQLRPRHRSTTSSSNTSKRTPGPKRSRPSCPLARWCTALEPKAARRTGRLRLKAGRGRRMERMCTRWGVMLRCLWRRRSGRWRAERD